MDTLTRLLHCSMLAPVAETCIVCQSSNMSVQQASSEHQTCQSTSQAFASCQCWRCRLLQVPGMGIESLGRVLSDFGFTKQDYYAFPRKQLLATW